MTTSQVYKPSWMNEDHVWKFLDNVMDSGHALYKLIIIGGMKTVH